MCAIVARPGVANAALDVELRFLRDQKHASATWTFGSAKLLGRSRFGVTGALQAHRRSPRRSTHRTPKLSLWLKFCTASVAPLRRLYETLVAIAVHKIG